MTGVAHIMSLPRPSRLGEFVRSRLRPLDIEPATVKTILDRYGLELVRPPANLPLSRRTRNILVPTTAGVKVLKLHRSRHPVQTIVYGHSILARLAELGFPATRLVQTSDGETFVSYEGGNYALYDFVEGVNYSLNFLLRRQRLALMAAAGRTLAQLHQQLAGFMPAGQHHLGFSSYNGGWRRDIGWFRAKVEQMQAQSRRLSNQEDQPHADWLIQNCQAILDEMARLDERLRPAPLPRLVIHGDYGLHNVLVRSDGTVTPLDFESARVEWRVSDLVSCLSRLRYGGGAFDFESMRRFVDAYQAEFQLSDDEWLLLPEVWRFYKLRAALIYWSSYLETGGPTRKLISARDVVGQSAWIVRHPEVVLALDGRGGRR